VSYGIYIGKSLTADGVAYLGGYGDEPSSHWLEIVKPEAHRRGTLIKVGVTPEADMPGLMTEIPQVEETAGHIRVSYSYYKGTPAPLTNGGLNQHGVAVRDIWSPSRPELVAMTPKTQTGPNYSDLARIVLERARTARDGVELMGRLIARHGHTTYGGNTHMIADPDEAWVVIQFAGGQGLWAAERLGEHSIRVSRPGYIEEVPVHDPSCRDYLFSDNFVSFAVSKGWYDPSRSQAFDANAVYGDGKGRWAGVRWMEEEMARRATAGGKITVQDVMWAVRTERLTGDTAGYGQVVPLARTDHDELRVLWHTQVGAVAAPFVPVFMGATKLPEEFGMHRYLTDGEAARCHDTREFNRATEISAVPQGVESTRSATQVFKRLQNLMFCNVQAFLPEIKELWEAHERDLLQASALVAAAAEELLRAGRGDLARHCLTYFTCNELMKSLEIAESLGKSLEIRTRLLFGISSNATPVGPAQIW
jgi:hypothetical protein